MKTKTTKLIYYVLFLITFAAGKADAQMVYIPDTNFRNWIATAYAGAIVGDSLDTTNSAVMSATQVNCSNKNIADLTGVEHFVSATYLNASNNVLTAFPPVPPLAKSVNVSSNDISSITLIPGYVTYLDISYNQMTSIDSLPMGLKTLYCQNNLLAALPTLPDSLVLIDCPDNLLTTLPAFPPKLQYASCYTNQLTSITSLDQSLTYLGLYQNSLTSLPALPSSLKTLDCTDNLLTSLPALPDSITVLHLSENFLTSLPTLPSQLIELVCCYNSLTALPSLPDSLYTLVCYANSLTALPTLPVVLDYLSFWDNFVTTLPPLPPALTQLHCGGNPITFLPSLPQSLLWLAPNYCSLTALPPLPDSLIYLDVRYNPITQLPTLPPSLESLYCPHTSITCLPVLPQSLQTLEAAGNGFSCLPNVPASLVSSDIGFMMCPIHYSACDTFPVIKGKVFYDNNNNGVFDAAEALVTQRLVSLSPNVWNGLTDTAGEFTAVVDTGNYVINVFTHKHDYVTTPIQTANVASYLDVDTDNVIGLYIPPNINDLEVHLISVNPPRPGFHNKIDIVYSNTGSTTLTGSVNFTFDNNYVFDSAAPPQFSQAGNVLTWNFSNMPPYTTATIRTYFNLPAGIPIGTVLTNTVTVNPLSNDSTPADNVDTLVQTVVGSFDPNDKSVEPSAVVTYLGNPLSDILKYTIRFQNTGTFLAENVTIIDTLDARLNPATFRLISSSHLCNVQIYGNLLSFTFSNINLPDSNSNEINSHGYVQFTINIDSGVNLSSPLINNADIYFDFNPPVRTPDAVVQFVTAGVDNIDDNSGVVLYPVPVNDVLYVSLKKPATSNTLMSITDIQGRVVKEEKITQSNSSVIPIDVSALSQGVYLLRMDGVVLRFVKL